MTAWQPDPAQVAREQALDELVSPYRTGAARNTLRSTDELFRALVAEQLAPPPPLFTPAEAAAAVATPPAAEQAGTRPDIDRLFERFFEHIGVDLEEQLRRPPPGQPPEFVRLWRALGLGIPKPRVTEGEAKTFLADELRGLYYLTLHQMLQSVIGATSAIIERRPATATSPTPSAARPPTSSDAEAADAPPETAAIDSLERDLAPAEDAAVLDDDDSFGDDAPPADPNSELLYDDLEVGQQSLYRTVWRAIAVELSLRESQRDGDGALRRRWQQLQDGSHAAGRDAMIRVLTEALERSRKLEPLDGIKFAALLVTAVIESSPANAAGQPWFRIEQEEVRRVATIRAAPALLERLHKLDARTHTISRNAPMIAPPRPWSPSRGIEQGGLHYRSLPLYKFPIHNRPVNQFLDELQQEATSPPDGGAFGSVFSAVNALQNTPWRINKRQLRFFIDLLAVLDEHIETFQDESLFPRPRSPKNFARGARVSPESSTTTSTEPADSPPIDDNAKADWLEWCAVEREPGKPQFLGRDRSRRRVGPAARLTTRVAISTIADLVSRERFWFAWQADTRGRLYPVAGILTPQGEPLARSMLEFANGKPIGTVDAVRALAIHGSNQISRARIAAYHTLASERDVTHDMRIAWIQAHNEEIKQSAANPLGHTWWRDVAKSPFAFLAFCFAWSDYLEGGIKTVSHLPVYVDGTCNGLQHVATIMRSRALALATNVLPDVAPHDIYSEVAAAVAASFDQKRDALIAEALEVEGDGPATRADFDKACDFVMAFGPALLDRDLGKSVVMIIPYGAGRGTFEKAIAERLHARKGAPLQMTNGASSTPEAWLNRNVNAKAWQPDPRSVAAVLGHLQPKDQAQAIARWATGRWLRRVAARLIAIAFEQTLADRFPEIGNFRAILSTAMQPVIRRGLPGLWAAPSGLPVMQRNFKVTPNDIDLQSRRGRLRFAWPETTDKINTMRQGTGILPNFIHSHDAAHLVLTVNLAAAKGVEALNTVHDGYATHASDVALMQQSLREAWIQLYPAGQSHLADFVKWCGELAALDPSTPASTSTAESAVATAWADGSRFRLRRIAAAIAEQPAPQKPEAAPKVKLPVLPEWDWIEQVRDSRYFFS